MPIAVFRADAGVAIGAGHVMRCLTLADKLSDNKWKCSFVCSNESLMTVPALDESIHEVIIINDSQIKDPIFVKENWPDGVDLVIIDHYQLNLDYEMAFRTWAERIFVIDDLANRSHEADILLDQTLGRKESEYKGLVNESCQLLLGTDFAMLRSDFVDARSRILEYRADRNECSNVLISLGATDPENMTGMVLDVLKESKQLFKVDIVLGASAPFRKQVSKKREEIPYECNLYIDPNIKKMIELMCADIAIGAAGTTSWERCCLGLPTILMVIADNQKENARELEKSGSVTLVNIKDNEMGKDLLVEFEKLVFSEEERNIMSKNAALLCDGLGVNRIKEIIIN